MSTAAPTLPTLQIRAEDVLRVDPLPRASVERLARLAGRPSAGDVCLAFWPDGIVAAMRFPPSPHGLLHAYIDGCMLRCAVGFDILAALERARRPRATPADVEADSSKLGALVNAAAVPKPEPIPEADVVRLATVDSDQFPGPRRLVKWPNGLAAVVVPNPTPEALRRAYAQARVVQGPLVIALALAMREAAARAEAQWHAAGGDIPRGAS